MLSCRSESSKYQLGRLDIFTASLIFYLSIEYHVHPLVDNILSMVTQELQDMFNLWYNTVVIYYTILCSYYLGLVR